MSKEASASGADRHLDSWAEDTDVSSAIDDHRKKVSTMETAHLIIFVL